MSGGAEPRVVAVIPARLASSRLPGKVLLDRTGKPLIQHVHEAAARAKRPTQLVVAVDDPRVAAAVESFGGRAIMTSVDHPNGTARCAQVAAELSLADHDIVVNVQGDEPEMDPELIDDAAMALSTATDPRVRVATCASPFLAGEDPANPNIVKVVLRADGRAMYFSRSLIPFPRESKPGNVQPLRHVGLYAYRVEFLRRYADLTPTDLESTEMLEQLRVLYHGDDIAVAVRASSSQGIDTPEQYEAFVARVNARR
jgi:3-deoxy-manno-octulosonate cytidylyltransferase (CMP-KDO synthetase)